ncbi:hypothetical protein G4B88_013564 [Cannabis sativa]|uniref:Ubiquitin-like protease family profile domain-containing protein n=1 Tax=Cannabis sativa TaxID=3483 RepID=A0A7J6F8M3_CANSA|nr:hypothetical protein G4B88_013564 [Cannabis sativa]
MASMSILCRHGLVIDDCLILSTEYRQDVDIMSTFIYHLKLRNITPTSVERLSLSLTGFFSGETTPEAVKFKIKGGSKPAGQPGLMGASSSSAHENVSRVEFEEFKKCLSVVVSQQGILMKSVAEMNKKLDILIEPEQSQGGEENIDVDATIASAVKAVENLIGSSTHVPASVETSEKTALEMVVFQETPILRPQKRDRKKGADHWICGRLNIAERRIYLYNSLRSGRYMTAAKEACKPFSVILPYYFSMLDFNGLRNEAKFSTMEPFPIVAVDGLPEQVTADCGVFVASFAEYFIDGKPIPSSGFDVEIHRDRLAVLFYQYGMKKQTENIESESEAPPSLPKKKDDNEGEPSQALQSLNAQESKDVESWVIPKRKGQNWLAQGQVEELKASGSFFTWSNKHEEGIRIHSKMDRILANESWIDYFQTLKQVTDGECFLITNIVSLNTQRLDGYKENVLTAWLKKNITDLKSLNQQLYKINLVLKNCYVSKQEDVASIYRDARELYSNAQVTLANNPHCSVAVKGEKSSYTAFRRLENNISATFTKIQNSEIDIKQSAS